MKRYFAPLLLLLILVLLACPAYSGLVVNEVMSNEPGSSTSLEWFELYNDSSAVAYLALYQIQVGGATIRLNEALDPYEYVVVCRKLYSDETSAGFEGVWGDSSGTWDTGILEESYREPIVASFPILTNSGSTISIINSSLVQVSYLSWNNVGADGVSWERVTSSQNLVGQSRETNGATPGYVNSITPLANDLALEDVSASSLGGSASLQLTVRNTGTLTSPAGQVTMYYDDASDPGSYNSVAKVLE